MAVDLSEQAVQIELNVAKITAKTLIAAIQQLLQNRNTITHGAQSLHKLNLQGRQLESIPVDQAELAAIRKELHQYAVDYSLMRDKETGRYTVFFKSQDVDRVYSGLKNFALNWGNRRRPMNEVMREAERTAEERNRNEPQLQHERTAERSKESR